MSKFTPGKWTWDMLPRKKGAIPITTPREEIAYVCASSRAEANAHLIAAAPELYELLCSVNSFLTRIGVDKTILSAIRQSNADLVNEAMLDELIGRSTELWTRIDGAETDDAS